MNREKNPRVCSVENAGGLDNSIRRFLQNPQKILKPYIVQGMNVLDVGCGPGFFTIEIVKLLKSSGKVIAADLQEGMLKKVGQKIKGTELEQKITLHKCDADKIGVKESVDFVLAFWMVHEVPDQFIFFTELKSILNPGGKLLIIEPKFHVPEKSFEGMVNRLELLGFKISDKPKVFFSRAVLMEN
jgi:ubiquinone/menaquinone biosynthesis C-methylase UbiE